MDLLWRLYYQYLTITSIYTLRAASSLISEIVFKPPHCYSLGQPKLPSA